MGKGANLKVWGLISLFLIVICCGWAVGKTIYVDANTPDSNDGSSWAKACAELQSALGAALYGDQIRVANGTYLPDYSVITKTHTGDRTATFGLVSGVAIYGGYAGFGAPDPNVRNPNTYPTILSGDLAGNDATVSDPCQLLTEPTRAENSYHVLTGSGTDSNAILDGFTITAGNAGEDSWPNSDGAGMFNEFDSSLRLINCSFFKNSAMQSGGGMKNDNSSPVLTDCTFSNNSAGWGGGMNNGSSSPELTNCIFTNNTANSDGGGIDNYNNSDPNITNCTFNGNSAGANGGAILNYEANPTLTMCSFNGNTAVYTGGAIHDNNSNTTITACNFTGNSAGTGGGIFNFVRSNSVIEDCNFISNAATDNGGGIYNDNSNPVVTNCTFSSNSASYGGGMNNYQSSPSLNSCSFTSNTAQSGGGIGNFENCSPTITDCTFNNNSAAYGGGMNNNNSSPTLTNCTLSNNDANNTGGGIFNDNSSSPAITNCILWANSGQISGGTPVVSYSCVQDNDSNDASVYPGIGNIDDDPLFADANGPDNIVGTKDDNLRLKPGSPCLDAGTNITTPPLPPTDLDGKPRIQNGIVDMGAYEGPAQVFVIEGAPVTVPEGDIEWFHVSLALEPNGPVEVTVAYYSGDTDISVLYGSTLNFNSSNYSTPQAVILKAAEDVDFLNETTIIRVSGFGIAPAYVTAVEADNDPVPPVIYVDDDANGLNNGSSWKNAFNYLQDALDTVANTGGKVNDIWVAQGTYRPDQGEHQTPGDRYASFHLLSGVKIYGGFAGFGAPNPDARDYKKYKTILSGDLNKNDGPNFVNNAENSYNIVTGSGTDSTAVIDGFTITAGNANGAESTTTRGGGMLNYPGSPTVTNCVFSGNSGGGNGGAVYNRSGGSPTMTNCTFVGNRANGGAAIWNSKSHPILTNCTFIDNFVTGNGGAIYNHPGTEAELGSNPVLINCVFTNNTAGGNGGAMYNRNGKQTLTNCTFNGNSAYSGGGMSNYEASSPTVTNCTFSNNSASYIGGGVYNYNGSSLKVTNCIFSDNFGRYGGGLCNLNEAAVTNCTITSNSASNVGGGIYNGGNITLTNNIIWDNNDSSGTGESALVLHNGSFEINYNCIQGLTGTLGGIGNINADPCFVDPAKNDYHLKSQGWSWDIKRNRWTYDDVTSRCIDAGNPGSPLGDEPITIPDDPDNEWGENLRIDMGAYGGTAEASMPPYDWTLLADLTNDGIVNLEDFAGQAMDWRETKSKQPGDLDRDGTVNINDLAIFVEDWLKVTSWN